MIIILQHGSGESPGVLLPLLEERDVSFDVISLYETNEIPMEDEPDGIIILGGQMSVNDEDVYPFLAGEKAFVRECVKKRLPVFGICLGAQIIASAFHARVYPAGAPERGWYLLERLEGFPSRTGGSMFPVFQWHGETFDLPSGATLLARGLDVTNQAFSCGSAIGVQFHPEVTGPIIARWVKDLSAGDRERICASTGVYLPASLQCCASLLDRFLTCR